MIVRYGSLAWLACVISSVVQAQTTPAADTDAQQRGQALFTKNMCYTCHGTVGQGGERGAGPKIAPNPWPYAAFIAQVRRPRQDMPRYPPQFLSDQELSDIYAYVASIKPSTSVKDIPLLSSAK